MLIAMAGLPAHVPAAGAQGFPAGMAGPNDGVPSFQPGTEIASGTAPKAYYPSDAYHPTSAVGPVPLLRSAIDRHNFPVVWAQGYRGQGVNVAVIDQGVDFGHPDLNGSYAVEGNATSPYYQWPLAFDPKSMRGQHPGDLVWGATWNGIRIVFGQGRFGGPEGKLGRIVKGDIGAFAERARRIPWEVSRVMRMRRYSG